MTRTKKSKLDNHHHQEEQEELIPGLPDHLSLLCLYRVNKPNLLYSVCHSWRKIIYSPNFPPFLSLYAILSPPINNKSHLVSNSIHISSFDPISSKWNSIAPSIPLLNSPPFLLHHPSFLSRQLPIQSVTLSNTLVFVSGTTNNLIPALSNPLIFNPLSNKWSLGPQINHPRRWCATGVVHGSLYIASGIGSRYNRDVAQSAERWCCSEDSSSRNYWEKISSLKDGRFSREAIEAVGWRGKLMMVNVKGNAVKEGVLYNVETDTWEDMPQGILIGWNGPTTTMDEEEIYTVDERKGVLKRYNVNLDVWESIIESRDLIGAVQITARGGKICVVCGGGNGILVVDLLVEPVKMWVLEPPPPPDLQVVGIHILPRMSCSCNESEL
ncbi:hypothetical protein C5167_018269 [Papaver somniferum]|uniref:F-box domain-containing protein n=1 Tax=Papaver somniferum TaxID=3469 RepID=A0A4Y7IQ48_PAPSO|nr:F-box/kelch-repeat protein SKIP25 [Papaver somniferum]RZC49841.1 hypothetical protein C5167_018269 [Papaver somniferum]